MSPIDVAWNDQWLSGQVWIHSLIKRKNQILIEQGKNSQLMYYLIDAYPRREIENLAKSKKKIIIIITEQTITDVPDNVKILNLPYSFYALYHSDHAVAPDIEITKDFNCFINRLDPIRQSWFYLLYSKGLLPRGYVSFNMELRQRLDYPGRLPKEVFDQYHNLYLSSFDSIKPNLDNIVPYKSFDDSLDLFTISAKSKFSIVIETYFERTDAMVFSEKTFRALQTPRPWFLFGATGCVNKLRIMGFDVFDDVIDHSYNEIDTSINANPVIDKILDQAQSLVDHKITPALLDRFLQGCQQNRKILTYWKQHWKDDILSTINAGFEQAMSY
jgi:hypothetical protein